MTPGECRTVTGKDRTERWKAIGIPAASALSSHLREGDVLENSAGRSGCLKRSVVRHSLKVRVGAACSARGEAEILDEAYNPRAVSLED